MHLETWTRSFKDDNPNARTLSCIVVSSQSHEYVQLKRWKLTSVVLLKFTCPTRLLGVDSIMML